MRQLGLVLATGYILDFYSERLFWSTWRPGDSVGDYLVTWLAYSVVAYLFLSIVSVLRVHGAPAVLIAGALYGWLVEGGVAGTLYGTEDSAPFPLSLLCTAVSWHALISVLVGWYLARRVLARNAPWQTLGLAAGVGVFWGCWAPFLWAETPPLVTPPLQFLVAGCAVTAPLVLCYWATERLGRGGFRPTWLGVSVATLLLGGFYAQHVVALGVRPLVILPGLLLAGMGVLLRQRAAAGLAETAAVPPSRCSAGNYLLLMAAPLVATGVYALTLWAGPHWPPLRDVIWWLSIAGGGALLVLSVVLVLAGRARQAPAAPPG